MVRDYDATVESLERLFGFRVLHVNVSEEAGIGRRGGMTWVGDGSVEIGEPAGANSPVQAFVERFGGGMHSIALQVDDTEAAKAHFAALDVAVATEPYAGMVWTRPADTAGVLIEWFSLEEPTDPRWGARVPDGPRPLVPVERLAFVTAMVRDGKVRPLAVTSKTRSAGLPDVPTVIEAGLPAAEVDTLFGIAAPALISTYGHLEQWRFCRWISRRCGVTLVFTVDLSRKRLRLRDLRPVLWVPGTLLPHAVAMRSSVTRRRML